MAWRPRGRFEIQVEIRKVRLEIDERKYDIARRQNRLSLAEKELQSLLLEQVRERRARFERQGRLHRLRQPGGLI